jgi:hypothetical protein
MYIHRFMNIWIHGGIHVYVYMRITLLYTCMYVQFLGPRIPRKDLPNQQDVPHFNYDGPASSDAGNSDGMYLFI